MTLKTAVSLLSTQNVWRLIRRPERIPESINYVFRKIMAHKRLKKMDWDGEEQKIPEYLAALTGYSKPILGRYLREIQEDETFYEEFLTRYGRIAEAGRMEQSGTTPLTDARTLYVLCRALKPSVVVETGVMYGSFDAHILQALDRNGFGELHSIDLPNEESDFENGYLIPQSLRKKWSLHLGDVNELLPELLGSIGEIDVFLHDSIHTAKHMSWEWNIAMSYLGGKGVLATHDILFAEKEFTVFAQEHKLENTKIGNVGIARASNHVDI